MRNNKIWVSALNTDKTADIVLEYIYYLEDNFLRIHEDNSLLSNVDIEIGNNSKEDKIVLSSKEHELHAHDQVKMWLRRGDFSYRFPLSNKGLNRKVDKYINQEWRIVKRFLHKYVSVLGDFYHETQSNKLQDLCTARDCGLSIPPTLVTTQKKKLIEFYTKYPKVISKPIHNGHLHFVEENKKYSSKGILFLDDKIIEKSSAQFCLSLFQAYIEKQYEIRIFFIGADLYSMAIFSQLDEKTAHDYRNYNQENPNRNVPYKLPVDIEAKVKAFIKKSNLNTGSIDLMYSQDKTYVFLEVNPAGQFGWVSTNCNYYIEKRIAEHLINYKK